MFRARAAKRKNLFRQRREGFFARYSRETSCVKTFRWGAFSADPCAAVFSEIRKRPDYADAVLVSVPGAAPLVSPIRPAGALTRKPRERPSERKRAGPPPWVSDPEPAGALKGPHKTYRRGAPSSADRGCFAPSGLFDVMPSVPRAATTLAALALSCPGLPCCDPCGAFAQASASLRQDLFRYLAAESPSRRGLSGYDG